MPPHRRAASCGPAGAADRALLTGGRRWPPCQGEGHAHWPPQRPVSFDGANATLTGPIVIVGVVVGDVVLPVPVVVGFLL